MPEGYFESFSSRVKARVFPIGGEVIENDSILVSPNDDTKLRFLGVQITTNLDDLISIYYGDELSTDNAVVLVQTAANIVWAAGPSPAFPLGGLNMPLRFGANNVGTRARGVLFYEVVKKLVTVQAGD